MPRPHNTSTCRHAIIAGQTSRHRKAGVRRLMLRHDHEHMIPLQYMPKDPKGTYTAARATASSTVSGAATAGARAGRHGGF